MTPEQRKLAALQHSANGQQRYCELIHLLKAFPRATEDALMALAVAAGQFVNSARQHIKAIISAAKECGIKYSRRDLYSWRIQQVIHYRDLAQDQSLVGWKTEYGDPRIKWSGDRYQSELGISLAEAQQCNLQMIVTRSVKRKVANDRKTPEQWRAQTQAASDARSAKSARNVEKASYYKDAGLSVDAIADKLSVCIRTVYNYFGRLNWHFVHLRFGQSSTCTKTCTEIAQKTVAKGNFPFPAGGCNVLSPRTCKKRRTLAPKRRR